MRVRPAAYMEYVKAANITAGKVMRGRGLNAVVQNEALEIRPWKILRSWEVVLLVSGMMIS